MTLPGRGKKPTSRSAEGRAAEDEKEEDPLVISKLGDMAHVKRVFDETIVGAVLDMGYDEQHAVTHVKIFLGLVTIAFALFAQFYPTPFPENARVLAVCVAGYGLFNALLQAFVTFVECGAILFTKPKHGAGRAAAKGLAVRTKMPRFQEVYTMTVHAGGKGAKAHECAEAAVSVCDYVYEDGVVDEDKIRELAEDVVRRFERGEFGRVGEGDNKRE